MAKDVLSRFPVIATANKPPVLLYPQFQLLLALTSATITVAPRVKSAGNTKVKMATTSASAAGVQDSKRLADNLAELLKSIGISFLPSNQVDADAGGVGGEEKNVEFHSRPSNKNIPPLSFEKKTEEDLLPATVVMPAVDQPVDMYEAAQRRGGESTLLRVQHVISEIVRMLEIDRENSLPDIATSQSMPRLDSSGMISGKPVNSGIIKSDEALSTLDAHANNTLQPIIWSGDPSLPADEDDVLDSRIAVVVKPIVIADSVPPPTDCPISALHVSLVLVYVAML